MKPTKKPTPRRATKDDAAAMIADGLFAMTHALERIAEAIEEHTKLEHPGDGNG